MIVVDGVLLTVAAAAVLLTAAGVVVTLATDDRDPSIVLAWLFVIVLAPVLGLVAYFLVGRNLRAPGRWTTRRRKPAGAMEEAHLAPTGGAATDFAEAAVEQLQGSPAGRVATIVMTEGGTEPMPADDVRLYFAGADKFRDLLADLAAATNHIHLMYLIWEQDELTAKVTETLLDRLDAGVRVHILYDWLSSLPYKKAELHRLTEKGAVVMPCYRRVPQLNYRNHMKIVIIDGDIVYSGGMNLGQEYIDGGARFDLWRDTHFRLTGPVASPYLELFAATWVRTGGPGDVLDGPPERPPAPLTREATPVQVVHSSASTPTAAIRNLFIVALTAARRRVWIQSPYFVPDEPTLTALCVAASSGVDVRLMMTGLPDKRLPFYAAHAYFGQVLASGVRVYQYTAGFMHAKSVLMDDDLVVLGTCNWDIRSLLLHDEVVAVIHGSEQVAECAGHFESDLRCCHEVTVEQMDSLGSLRRARNSLCRLTSRLL
ncbi:MAG: cardiolipin synthase [Nocardioidaceae bacterium]